MEFITSDNENVKNVAHKKRCCDGSNCFLTWAAITYYKYLGTQPRACRMSICTCFGPKTLAFEARCTGEGGQGTGKPHCLINSLLTLVTVCIEHFDNANVWLLSLLSENLSRFLTCNWTPYRSLHVPMDITSYGCQ